MRRAASLAPVVLDINVLVAAVVGQEMEAAFESWPSPPPLRGDVSANAVGVLNDAVEFSLWLSPHVLDGTKRVLREFYRWSEIRAIRYERALKAISARSGEMSSFQPRPSPTAWTGRATVFSSWLLPPVRSSL